MMKKFTAAVVLGAIVGAVAYKLKKEYDDQKMLENELDMLTRVENEEEKLVEETCDESEKEETCNTENEKEETETPLEEIIDEVVEESKEVVEEVKETVKDVVEDIKEKVEDVVENKSVDESTNEKKTTFLDESLEENPLTAEIKPEYKKILDAHSDSVILQLALEDDVLEEERPIQHFVDFKSNEDMEKFKANVIEKGYVVTRGETPYQLSVLHIAPINRSELLVNVYYLANQAIKNNGTYQGWQSRKVL